MPQICLNDSYLEGYRDAMLAAGLATRSNDKLRDVDDHFFANGHVFLFNQELICSFDVCGGCEAHAIIAQMKSSNIVVKDSSERTRKRYRKLVAKCRSDEKQSANHNGADDGDLAVFCGINKLSTLRDLVRAESSLLSGNVNFAKCPLKIWQIS
jgi:hypothetical protein